MARRRFGNRVIGATATPKYCFVGSVMMQNARLLSFFILFLGLWIWPISRNQNYKLWSSRTSRCRRE